jgi:hypothetical protein
VEPGPGQLQAEPGPEQPEAGPGPGQPVLEAEPGPGQPGPGQPERGVEPGPGQPGLEAERAEAPVGWHQPASTTSSTRSYPRIKPGLWLASLTQTCSGS